MTTTLDTRTAGHLYLVAFTGLPADTTAEQLRDALMVRLSHWTAGSWDVVASRQTDDGTVDYLLGWDRSDPETDYHGSAHDGGHDGSSRAAATQLINELREGANETPHPPLPSERVNTPFEVVADLPLNPAIVTVGPVSRYVTHDRMRAWAASNVRAEHGWQLHPGVWNNEPDLVSPVAIANEDNGSGADVDTDEVVVPQLLDDRDVAIALIRTAAERHSFDDVLATDTLTKA